MSPASHTRGKHTKQPLNVSLLGCSKNLNFGLYLQYEICNLAEVYQFSDRLSSFVAEIAIFDALWQFSTSRFRVRRL